MRQTTLAARRGVWRDAALHAGTELFASRGFHETGMGDIAAAAGLSLRALYEVFPGKEQLFVAVVDEAFGHLEPLLPEEPAPGDPGQEMLSLVTGLFGFMTDNHDVCLLYSRATQSAPARLSDGRDPFAGYLQVLQDRIAARIRVAQAAGYATGVRAEVLAESIRATIVAVAVSALTTDPSADLSELGPDVAALYRPYFTR